MMEFSEEPGAVQLLGNRFDASKYASEPACELAVPYAYEALLDPAHALPDVLARGPAMVVPETAALPAADLSNYPNPFNPETWIPYELSQDSEVKVWIYDVGGQLVRWMEVGFQEAGIYSSREKAIYWNGKSQDGERVASGVYFYSLELGKESQTRRMVILK